MAKRVKKVTAPTVPNDADLRRWCIEQAIRWPLVGPNYAQGGQQLGYVPQGEADVIGRAKRLLTWVTTK